MNFLIVLATLIVAGTIIIAFEAVGGWPGLFAVAIAATVGVFLARRALKRKRYERPTFALMRRWDWMALFTRRVTRWEI